MSTDALKIRKDIEKYGEKLQHLLNAFENVPSLDESRIRVKLKGTGEEDQFIDLFLQTLTEKRKLLSASKTIEIMMTEKIPTASDQKTLLDAPQSSLDTCHKATQILTDARLSVLHSWALGLDEPNDTFAEEPSAEELAAAMVDLSPTKKEAIGLPQSSKTETLARFMALAEIPNFFSLKSSLPLTEPAARTNINAHDVNSKLKQTCLAKAYNGDPVMDTKSSVESKSSADTNSCKSSLRATDILANAGILPSAKPDRIQLEFADNVKATVVITVMLPGTDGVVMTSTYYQKSPGTPPTPVDPPSLDSQTTPLYNSDPYWRRNLVSETTSVSSNPSSPPFPPLPSNSNAAPFTPGLAAHNRSVPPISIPPTGLPSSIVGSTPAPSSCSPPISPLELPRDLTSSVSLK